MKLRNLFLAHNLLLALIMSLAATHTLAEDDQYAPIIKAYSDAGVIKDKVIELRDRGCQPVNITVAPLVNVPHLSGGSMSRYLIVQNFNCSAFFGQDVIGVLTRKIRYATSSFPETTFEVELAELNY